MKKVLSASSEGAAISPAAAAGGEEIVDRAGLALVVGLRGGFGLRRGDAGRQRRDYELPQRLLAQFGDESALGQVQVAQRVGEAGGIEGAGLVAEIRVRGDDFTQRVVGNVEAELARLFVDRRFAQELLQDAAVEADLSRASSLVNGRRSRR